MTDKQIRKLTDKYLREEYKPSKHRKALRGKYTKFTSTKGSKWNPIKAISKKKELKSLIILTKN